MPEVRNGKESTKSTKSKRKTFTSSGSAEKTDKKPRAGGKYKMHHGGQAEFKFSLMDKIYFVVIPGSISVFAGYSLYRLYELILGWPEMDKKSLYTIHEGYTKAGYEIDIKACNFFDSIFQDEKYAEYPVHEIESVLLSCSVGRAALQLMKRDII
jgi:hypothetical protein